MSTEVFFSYLPRDPRSVRAGPRQRGLIMLEAHDGGDSKVAVIDIPPEVLANLTAVAALAGHGLLDEILRRLTYPRPVAWNGRTVR